MTCFTLVVHSKNVRADQNYRTAYVCPDLECPINVSLFKWFRIKITLIMNFCWQLCLTNCLCFILFGLPHILTLFLFLCFLHPSSQDLYTPNQITIREAIIHWRFINVKQCITFWWGQKEQMLYYFYCGVEKFSIKK